MNILISKEIENAISAELPKAKDEINIITGYCKLSTLKYIDSIINKTVKKRLLVRFLPSDLASGATDKEIYDFCKNNNWELYVDFTIHAKTYVFDKIKCILGSANLTNKGLSLNKVSGNKEIASYFNLDNDSYLKILTLYENSFLLDDDLFDEITKSISDEDAVKIATIRHPNLKRARVTVLMPEDFPTAETDLIELYQLKSFIWLIQFLKDNNNFSYFGELTAHIHELFIKDPRPYRKDIKQHLIDLLDAIERFKIDFLSIDRPNYSQRIIYKEPTHK